MAGSDVAKQTTRPESILLVGADNLVPLEGMSGEAECKQICVCQADFKDKSFLNGTSAVKLQVERRTCIGEEYSVCILLNTKEDYGK